MLGIFFEKVNNLFVIYVFIYHVFPEFPFCCTGEHASIEYLIAVCVKIP